LHQGQGHCDARAFGCGGGGAHRKCACGGHRGKRNDSINVKYIAEKIAKVKGYSTEEVAKMTYENTCRIFEIKGE